MQSAFLKKISIVFQKHKYVLLYGAGGVTEDLLLLLEPCLCKSQTYIVVSDKRGNPNSLKGYPVKEITEFADVHDEVYIIISVMPRYMSQIETHLKKLGFHNYCRASHLADQMYREIWTSPPSKNKIIFANGDGYGFGGNPKYIAMELLKRNADFDLVWITNDCKAELPEGIRAVRYGSYEHYHELGTARIWIDNQHKNYFTGIWLPLFRMGDSIL